MVVLPYFCWVTQTGISRYSTRSFNSNTFFQFAETHFLVVEFSFISSLLYPMRHLLRISSSCIWTGLVICISPFLLLISTLFKFLSTRLRSLYIRVICLCDSREGCFLFPSLMAIFVLAKFPVPHIVCLFSVFSFFLNGFRQKLLILQASFSESLEINKADIMGALDNFHLTSYVVRSCNALFIALIKRKVPLNWDFRSISLIGSEYKVYA